MNETDKYILDRIKIWIWSGFYDADEVEEMLEDILEDDADEDFLLASIKNEFKEKKAAEKTWQAETDCDRLDEAFDELNEDGIIALQNAGYTMSDGIDDVREVYSESKKDEIKGYCFYHEQDLERAIDGGGLMIAFGVFEDDDKNKKTEIGKTVKQILENAGFKVEWRGDAEERLSIPKVEWKRRTVFE